MSVFLYIYYVMARTLGSPILRLPLSPVTVPANGMPGYHPLASSDTIL